VNVPDDPSEANDSDGVECPYGIAPDEINDRFNDRFDSGRLGAIATGMSMPKGEEYQQIMEAIDMVNPEAAEWIDGPADLKHVLGSNAGSPSGR
jgi:hypothetical protein